MEIQTCWLMLSFTRSGYECFQQDDMQMVYEKLKTADRYCDSPVLCLTHPHVCRHTYCSNMGRSEINVKTLQYLMRHSDISTTLNVYTHEDFTGAEEELKRLSII